MAQNKEVRILLGLIALLGVAVLGVERPVDASLQHWRELATLSQALQTGAQGIIGRMGTPSVSRVRTRVALRSAHRCSRG